MITDETIERIRQRINLRRVCQEDGPEAHDDVRSRLLHEARDIAIAVKPLFELLVEAGLIDVHLLLDRHNVRFLDDNRLITDKNLDSGPEKPYAEVHFEVDRLSRYNQPESCLTLKIGEARSFDRPESKGEITDLVHAMIEDNSDFNRDALILALQQHPRDLEGSEGDDEGLELDRPSVTRAEAALRSRTMGSGDTSVPDERASRRRRFFRTVYNIVVLAEGEPLLTEDLEAIAYTTSTRALASAWCRCRLPRKSRGRRWTGCWKRQAATRPSSARPTTMRSLDDVSAPDTTFGSAPRSPGSRQPRPRGGGQCTKSKELGRAKINTTIAASTSTLTPRNPRRSSARGDAERALGRSASLAQSVEYVPEQGFELTRDPHQAEAVLPLPWRKPRMLFGIHRKDSPGGRNEMIPDRRVNQYQVGLGKALNLWRDVTVSLSIAPILEFTSAGSSSSWRRVAGFQETSQAVLGVALAANSPRTASLDNQSKCQHLEAVVVGPLLICGLGARNVFLMGCVPCVNSALLRQTTYL